MRKQATMRMKSLLTRKTSDKASSSVAVDDAFPVNDNPDDPSNTKQTEPDQEPTQKWHSFLRIKKGAEDTESKDAMNKPIYNDEVQRFIDKFEESKRTTPGIKLKRTLRTLSETKMASSAKSWASRGKESLNRKESNPKQDNSSRLFESMNQGPMHKLFQRFHTNKKRRDPTMMKPETSKGFDLPIVQTNDTTMFEGTPVDTPPVPTLSRTSSSASTVSADDSVDSRDQKSEKPTEPPADGTVTSTARPEEDNRLDQHVEANLSHNHSRVEEMVSETDSDTDDDSDSDSEYSRPKDDGHEQLRGNASLEEEEDDDEPAMSDDSVDDELQELVTTSTDDDDDDEEEANPSPVRQEVITIETATSQNTDSGAGQEAILRHESSLEDEDSSVEEMEEGSQMDPDQETPVENVTNPKANNAQVTENREEEETPSMVHQSGLSERVSNILDEAADPDKEEIPSMEEVTTASTSFSTTDTTVREPPELHKTDTEYSIAVHSMGSMPSQRRLVIENAPSLMAAPSEATQATNHARGGVLTNVLDSACAGWGCVNVMMDSIDNMSQATPVNQFELSEQLEMGDFQSIDYYDDVKRKKRAKSKMRQRGTRRRPSRAPFSQKRPKNPQPLIAPEFSQSNSL